MENLTGVSMREYANFIHALSTRTASRNSSNFQSHFYLFSVGFMKGGKESKELCSVSGLGLRLHGRFSRNFVYCCMLLYVVCVFTFAECSPSPRRKVFSFHNTDPRDIISLLFMTPKEGLYLHASLFFSSEFISLHWT